jgi:hypothetical protein
VPGNHDISLDNVLVRLLDPWGRYRNLIHDDLSPRHEDEEIAVIGLNTVNRYAHQAGRIGRSQLRVIAGAHQENPLRDAVVVMHHPPEHPTGSTKRPMRHSGKGVEALAQAGADIVLSGHLHNAHVRPDARAGDPARAGGDGLPRGCATTQHLNLLASSRAVRWTATRPSAGPLRVIETALVRAGTCDPQGNGSALALAAGRAAVSEHVAADVGSRHEPRPGCRSTKAASDRDRGRRRGRGPAKLSSSKTRSITV